jgi:hypothetical protein
LHTPDEGRFVKEMKKAFVRVLGQPNPDLSQFPEILIACVAVPGMFFHIIEVSTTSAEKKSPYAIPPLDGGHIRLSLRIRS